MVPKSQQKDVVWKLQPGSDSVPCLWDYLQSANLDTLKLVIPKYWGTPKPGDCKSLYKAQN